MPDPIVIVGGGFAGVATAYHLARSGAGRVVLLERDPAPGQQASGRNAGMIRTLVADPDVQRLALASAATLASPPADLGGGFFRRTGSLILASGEDVPPLLEAADRSREAGRDVVVDASPPPAAEPWLHGVAFDRCFFTPDDGVADVHALLTAYLGAAVSGGLDVRTGVEVTALEIDGDRVSGVDTTRGSLRAAVVVNATGAWAAGIGARGAGPDLGIGPRRRHLHSTGPVPDVDPDLPFIWHDTAGFYFRPESGGFLLSGCDETPQAPGDAVVDPAEEDRLAAKLVAEAPALAELPVRNRWACLRTFSGRGGPVIGWDPRLAGLYWVAALGGHGVTMSAAVGDLAAREIVAGPDGSAPNPLAPARHLP